MARYGGAEVFDDLLDENMPTLNFNSMKTGYTFISTLPLFW